MAEEIEKFPRTYSRVAPKGMMFKRGDRVTLSGHSAVKGDRSFCKRDDKDKTCEVIGFITEGLITCVLVVVRFDDGQEGEYWPIELLPVLL